MEAELQEALILKILKSYFKVSEKKNNLCKLFLFLLSIRTRRMKFCCLQLWVHLAVIIIHEPVCTWYMVQAAAGWLDDSTVSDDRPSENVGTCGRVAGGDKHTQRRTTLLADTGNMQGKRPFQKERKTLHAKGNQRAGIRRNPESKSWAQSESCINA